MWVRYIQLNPHREKNVLENFAWEVGVRLMSAAVSILTLGYD